ncbi:NAD(P)-binding protein [Hydrogenophaga sp.]|uniref:NAD(P)-binding protein n=1 Tax=Hydrogenophaga sp. TaxID=1904254 RepID=UPI00271CA695|nr:NAD(P)-binding protein [Hydrogenophaga sp.]MDO9436714.1 NAD(P)-binding protein [Hydrogenophaga sp.]
MSETIREVDYVIVGAGAVGMAMADTLTAETSATVAIVDRRAKPGGHWNDAYPFVRLHGPSATYGVNSLPLGRGQIDTKGLNAGLNELASGAEICAYYDHVMQQLLTSGRVSWLPMHDVDETGMATSLVNGQRVRLVARRRWVDATQADTRVPVTHGPGFAVADGVTCLTPTELTQWDRPVARHVIVGGGKTAMDTALWLLEQGVDPDSITWIRPREAWLLNRANVQPTAPFALQTMAAMVAEFEAARDATSLPDLFARLEGMQLLQRIDPTVTPTMYRCAVVSTAELTQLRRIRNVVRLGRVKGIELDRILLDQGEIPTSVTHVHIHCSAGGLPRGPVQPVFQGHRIVPQYLRRCSPSFSAALIAHLEATIEDDAVKNAQSEPVLVPEIPVDWLRMFLQTARNQAAWSQHPELQNWLRRSRLEAYAGLFAQLQQEPNPEWEELQVRLKQARVPGLHRMAALVDSAKRKHQKGERKRQLVPGVCPNKNNQGKTLT